MWPFRRTVRGNARKTAAVYAVPDRFGVQAASLGAMTNTFSPGSAGMHSPAATARGYTGLAGHGVNQWSGDGPPLQSFGSPPAPVLDPLSKRVGFGAGPSGQPGMPSTGAATGGLSSLAWLSYNPNGRTGLGG